MLERHCHLHCKSGMLPVSSSRYLRRHMKITMRCRASRSAVLLLFLAAPAVSAQSRWLPPQINMGRKLKGAAREAALARLQAIDRLIKQVPEFAHPEGFDIKADFVDVGSRTGLNESVHSDYVVEYRYTMLFFAPKFTPTAQPTGAVVFMVNGEENMRGKPDAQGRTIFVEEPRWPRTPFSVATYGTSSTGAMEAGKDFTITTWFTAGGELPWRPVTREDYYNSLIAETEGNGGELRAQHKAVTEKTGYQKWLEEAPKRKKEREEVISVVAQSNAAEAAKLRKTLEDTDREMGEEFRKNESNDRADAKKSFEPTDNMRAELNRMTVAQRKLPAIVDVDPKATQLSATGASLRDRDTASATVHRVLTPNYDFWRARRSPDEVRTIAVHLESAPDPAITNAIYQMYQKFDWRALAAIANEAPRR